MSEPERLIYFGKELVSASRCIVDCYHPGTCARPRLPGNWRCEVHDREYEVKRKADLLEWAQKQREIYGSYDDEWIRKL